MLINDQEFAIHDHIIFIALKKLLSAHSIVEVADHWGVNGFIEIADSENLLNFCDALFENAYSLLFLVDFVMQIT